MIVYISLIQLILAKPLCRLKPISKMGFIEQYDEKNGSFLQIYFLIQIS